MAADRPDGGIHCRAIAFWCAGAGAATTQIASSWRGPQRIRALARQADVLVYLNNDWEGFAVRNAQRLEQLLARHGHAECGGGVCVASPSDSMDRGTERSVR